MLKFENVSLSVGKNAILQDLHFEVEPGEMVAILGASGAGKSSLFRLLIGEIGPTVGQISLDGFPLRNVNHKSLQQYRRQIGIIFQDFRLFPQKTAYENVAFALEVCGEEHLLEERVPKALKTVGLWDRRTAFPRELSGGESQRVAIARALVHAPKILIADEATGNLDPKNSREIAELFRMLNQKRKLTILFATHDPVMIEQIKPRIIRLENGKVLFDKNGGSVKECFEGIF